MRISRWLGCLWLPLLWIGLKYGVHISDRYLPDPIGVLNAARTVEPNIGVQTLFTITRFAIGFIGGTALGIATGLLLYRSEALADFLIPAIESSRSVPAIAIIPFFLLWFGFSETGKYLLVLTGTTLNIAIATLQIVRSSPERFETMFKSFKRHPSWFPMRYGLPYVCEHILPTLRFSLASAIGLIVASEMLGAQTGLGYLAQSARSTFSLDLLFLTILILGLVGAMADAILVRSWKTLLFWTKQS